MLSILGSILHAFIGLRDRRVIFTNHAVELVFGWKIEELIGKTIRVLYRSDEEYEEIASYAYPALEKQRTYSREIHCRHKDGRDIFCLVSSSRVGEILKDRMVVVTYSDITEQKRAEESLRLVNIYNRSLLETCLDLMVVIDPAGKISDVNAATEKGTGYLREESIGTDVSNYFTDAERVKAEYRRVFREGAVYNYPLEIRHREGRVTPVLYSTSVYRDESYNVVGIFATARDITERKRMEEHLRNARARLLTVLDGLNASVYIIDMSTYEVLYINEHMKNLFGDITGKICWQSILNQSGPCEFCVDERLLTLEAESSGVHVWEQYHAALGIWFLIQDQVIRWMDGRLCVRRMHQGDVLDRVLPQPIGGEDQGCLRMGSQGVA